MRQNITATIGREFVEVQGKAPNPLLAVTTWELRRLTAKRSSLVQALVIFLVFSFFAWVGRTPVGNSFESASTGQRITVMVNIGTSWGLAHSLVLILLLFGLLVPFISADGISLDLKRRTHELLMTTAVPTWAYLAGRFLAVLVTSLALSLIMMLAILVTPLLIGYTMADLLTVLLLWLIMVVPAVTLLASLSFALATWLPQLSSLIKIGVLILWLGGAFIISTVSPFNTNTIDGYSADDRNSLMVGGLFDPTSNLMATALVRRYEEAFNLKLYGGKFPGASDGITQAQVDQAMNQVAQSRPDVTPWVLPHLGLVLVGVLLVTGAGLRFQRFTRNFK